MKKGFLLLFVFSVVIVGCNFEGSDSYNDEEFAGKITDFNECVVTGNPVTESYPRQCIADGELFVEQIEDSKHNNVAEEKTSDSTGEGLGDLCSSKFSCFIFCGRNKDECMDYCLNNPDNEICQSMRKMMPSPGEENGMQERNYRTRPDIPGCDGQKLTIPPVELSKLESVTPLGNLNPPEHTIPTQHMYLHLSEQEVDLRAPGDIIITEIQTTRYLLENKEDYGIRFALCDGVRGYFLHVKELSPKIKSMMEGERCDSNGAEKYEYCQAVINEEVKAGTILGKAADSEQNNFDFGVYDYRTQLEFAKPSRYRDSTSSIVCPFDLYDTETKNNLYGKLDSTIGSCGEVAQDIPGTLKGNWFYGDVMADQPDSWEQSLAFAHNNHDPSKLVISIGGVFTDAGFFEFTPESSGTVNRDFKDVTADGNIYCYEPENAESKIIVQMIDDENLNIEHQPGNCNGNYQFSNPTSYNR